MKGKLCVMSPVPVSTNCYVPYFFTFTVIIQFVIINSPAVFSLRSLSFVNDSCKKVHFEFWGKIKICATASFASFFPLLYLLWAEVRWSETRNVQKSWMCNIWPGERGGEQHLQHWLMRARGSTLMQTQTHMASKVQRRQNINEEARVFL